MTTNQIAGAVSGQPFDRMLSVKEVAEVFSISVREVWRKVDRGDLPRPVKVGRLCRWLGTEIHKVIERLKQQRDGGKGGAR